MASKRSSRRFWYVVLALVSGSAGYFLARTAPVVQAESSGGEGEVEQVQTAVDGVTIATATAAAMSNNPERPLYLRQSPGMTNPDWKEHDWGLGDGYVDKLTPFPILKKGDRTPFDLWRYAGKCGGSFANPDLPFPSFEEWMDHNLSRKPKLMVEVREYMNLRYNFSGESIPGVYMSGGKAIMVGPVARLPEGVGSFERFNELSAHEIKSGDLFPYKPLCHPIQTTAHMVFPAMWIMAHPEHQRFDMDHDIPDAYLPEFPPPLFLTTHKELGDVTRGQEVTIGNYYEIFNGLLTAEQMEGLKELLRPSPTTWFNQTHHRVTAEPNAGVSCFDCHVNGHTNGAFELAPDSRPNLARLRTDTPTMRGNFNLMQLSSKRSIRSMDHFAEVEEYFDGDPGMMQAIGPRGAQRQITNRMGDFNAIIDNPPAPKLGPLMKLIPTMATQQELRGEELFHGKAQCSVCHYGPAFVDDYMHDLQAERFYAGRPEGPIKTFPLRGIKDSPPYLHDGRAPTLHDAVEFFNIVLELKLDKQEKEDLVAYMLCL
jgi:cytochrome c peroxidase